MSASTPSASVVDAWGLPTPSHSGGAGEASTPMRSSAAAWTDPPPPQLDMRTRGTVADVVFWRSHAQGEAGAARVRSPHARSPSPPPHHPKSEPFSKALPHCVPWEKPSPEDARERRISALQTLHTAQWPVQSPFAGSKHPFLTPTPTPLRASAAPAATSTPASAAPSRALQSLPAALARTLSSASPSLARANAPAASPPPTPPGSSRRSLRPVSRGHDHLGLPLGPQGRRQPRRQIGAVTGAPTSAHLEARDGGGEEGGGEEDVRREVERVRKALESPRPPGMTPHDTQSTFQRSLRPPSGPTATTPAPPTTPVPLSVTSALLLPPSTNPAVPSREQRKSAAAGVPGPSEAERPEANGRGRGAPGPANGPITAGALSAMKSVRSMRLEKVEKMVEEEGLAVPPALVPPSKSSVVAVVKKRWAVKKAVEAMRAGRAPRPGRRTEDESDADGHEDSVSDFWQQQQPQQPPPLQSTRSTSFHQHTAPDSVASITTAAMNDPSFLADEGDDVLVVGEGKEQERREGRDGSQAAALQQQQQQQRPARPHIPTREHFLALTPAGGSQRNLLQAATGAPAESADTSRPLTSANSVASMTRAPSAASLKVRKGAGLGDAAGETDTVGPLPPAPSLDQVLVLGKYASHLHRRAQSMAAIPAPVKE